MSHELSPFLLSIKKTEIRYSLLAAFPWTAFEYPNINSKFPDTLYFGYDVTELATVMADIHGYTGDDRQAYIARIVSEGLESQKEWDRDPSAVAAAYAPLEAAVARWEAERLRDQINQGVTVSFEQALHAIRHPPLPIAAKKAWWSNWTPLPWSNIFVATVVAGFIGYIVTLIYSILTQ